MKVAKMINFNLEKWNKLHDEKMQDTTATKTHSSIVNKALDLYWLWKPATILNKKINDVNCIKCGKSNLISAGIKHEKGYFICSKCQADIINLWLIANGLDPAVEKQKKLVV